MPTRPIAFLSYVHFDDQHENGRLTQFRERLSAEMRIQTGEEFIIFQDRNDIAWGQLWKERIEESLDEVTFLIPIITPSYFKSEMCRFELERFLEREKKLNHNDLILPVYYVDCPALNDSAKRQCDRLIDIIAARQYIDWRELRFEPFTSPQAGKTLARLAVRINDVLDQVRVEAAMSTLSLPQISGTDSALPTDTSAISPISQSGNESLELKRKNSQKTLARIHIVDQRGIGEFSTIREAMASASPGDRILVRSGFYQEALILDKPLEIIGDGDRNEIVVQSAKESVITFKTTLGRVTNLTLRQTGGGDCYGIDIAQGHLLLENCDISCHSLACVAIYEGADPRLRWNRIHNGKSSGVFIYANGMGTLEENDIFDNDLAGVEIKTGAAPTLRHNRIYQAKGCGILIHKNGQGVIEDNEIFANAFAGVEIRSGGNPSLRQNRIHDGKHAGVLIQESGQGFIEDNDIFGNVGGGIEIRTHGNPTLRQNRIYDGKKNGVVVYDDGLGLLEENDIWGNDLAGIEVRTGGDPIVRKNRIHDGKRNGVLVQENGKGKFEYNNIYSNFYHGIKIRTKGNPIIRSNRIRNGREGGILVLENGQGLFEKNDIFDNALAGVTIRSQGNPKFLRNRIRNNKRTGVWVYDCGLGRIEDNSITGNSYTGVEINTGGNPTVCRNRINKNHCHAISVHKEGVGTFENNDLRDNSQGAWDIFVNHETKLVREGNLE